MLKDFRKDKTTRPRTALWQEYKEGKISEYEYNKLRAKNLKSLGYTREMKMDKNLFKDLKTCVDIMSHVDERLGKRLDDFIGEALIEMELTKKEASVFEKWYYDEK